VHTHRRDGIAANGDQVCFHPATVQSYPLRVAELSLTEVRLLGPIEVLGPSGAHVNLGSRKQRSLLAILALAHDHVVSADRLIDDLWEGDPPERAIVSLYSYVSNLRQLLEPRRDAPPSVLTTVPPGYALRVPDIAVDVRRFELAAHDVSDLLEQQNWRALRATAHRALSWWRGPALGEFSTEPFAALHAARLEELRQVMVEDLCESRVEMNDGHVIADLDRFVSEHPLRERAWGLLMRALYAGGRQSDALRTYQRARSILSDELGVEPGPQLRDLERSILRHDDPLGDIGGGRERSTMRVSASEPPTSSSVDGHVGNPTGSHLPIVGRTSELRICREVLDDTTRGPRALIAGGEPGIGKTRLIEEVAALAAADGALVLWGRSPDAGPSPAFWPWLPTLRALIGLDDHHDLHPGLDALLSSSQAETRTTSETERYSLFDSIVALIERAARRHKVMIVLDDLQWADTASLELTIALATRLSSPGVLLAVTTRELDGIPNDVRVAALAALTRMTGSRRLELSGLDPDDTTELLSLLTNTALNPTVTTDVFDRAEGNPFFTIEIARLISDTTRTTRQLAEVPRSIRDVILRRLDPMPSATLELLRTASVIGREVDAHLLTAVTGRHDLLDCLETLEPAVLHRLVAHIDQRPGTYRFAHGLVRDVLLDQTPLQLAKAHLAIADALDRSDDTTEILAEHLWAAAPLADTHRTATQLEEAAQIAMSRGAYEAAQHHLERAASLYHSNDPAAGVDRGRTLSLLSSVSVFNRSPIASELLAPGTGRSGIDGADVGSVIIRLLEFYSLIVECDFAAADPIAHELGAIAEVTDDPLIRSSGHSAFGCSNWYHGRFTDAAQHLDRAIEAMDHVEATSEAGPIDAIQMSWPHAVRCHIHDLMGRLDDPESAADQVRLTLDGDRLWSVIVSDFSCLGAFMVGDHERARREADRAIALDPHTDFARWSRAILACRLAAHCAGGDAELGQRALRRFTRAKTAGANRTTMSIIYATLSLGLSRHGAAADAADAASYARAEIDPHTDLYTEPLVLTAEAAVAATRPGSTDEASRLLNRALVVTERQGARAVGDHVHRVARDLGYDMAITPP
jgi:DNA-binding SARP family transcriptional activator/tetratricopeptide (TPR) repeat protein